jgi:hypothetical protein
MDPQPTGLLTNKSMEEFFIICCYSSFKQISYYKDHIIPNNYSAHTHLKPHSFGILILYYYLYNLSNPLRLSLQNSTYSSHLSHQVNAANVTIQNFSIAYKN